MKPTTTMLRQAILAGAIRNVWVLVMGIVMLGLAVNEQNRLYGWIAGFCFFSPVIWAAGYLAGRLDQLRDVMDSFIKQRARKP